MRKTTREFIEATEKKLSDHNMVYGKREYGISAVGIISTVRKLRRLGYKVIKSKNMKNHYTVYSR